MHLTLEVDLERQAVGLCDAGPEMTFHFGQLIAHICKTRNVRAGRIVGSGTVSNKDWARGYSLHRREARDRDHRGRQRRRPRS